MVCGFPENDKGQTGQCIGMLVHGMLLEETLVDSGAWMAALQVYWRKSLEIQTNLPSHQTALITMIACSTTMQLFIQPISYVPMSRYIVPFILRQSTDHLEI